MRLLLQRVKHASVVVAGETIGEIEKGLLILAGFCPDDQNLPQSPVWQKILKKVLALRIFPDAEGKLNLSVMDFMAADTGDCGEDTPSLLVVPQFTLYADCKKGLRPSFHVAAKPDMARILYKQLVADFETLAPGSIRQGRFGADMDVSLLNWGPVTILLDSQELGPKG